MCSENKCSTERQLRDRASTKKPMRLQEYVTVAKRFVVQDDEPESSNEALKSKKYAKWTAAMQSEMSSLKENWCRRLLDAKPFHASVSIKLSAIQMHQ
jgi:hypothetical protein